MVILEIPKILKIFKSIGMAHLGFILLVKDKTDKETINHEIIHIRQQWETLIVGWYIIYILNFLINLMIFGKFWKAYEKVSFEQEAYKYEKDYTYLKNRKLYNWIYYGTNK